MPSSGKAFTKEEVQAWELMFGDTRESELVPLGLVAAFGATAARELHLPADLVIARTGLKLAGELQVGQGFQYRVELKRNMRGQGRFWWVVELDLNCGGEVLGWSETILASVSGAPKGGFQAGEAAAAGIPFHVHQVMVDQYLELLHDLNPLHRPSENGSRAMVPAGLLLGWVEVLFQRSGDSRQLVSLKGVFSSPALVDSNFYAIFVQKGKNFVFQVVGEQGETVVHGSFQGNR